MKYEIIAGEDSPSELIRTDDDGRNKITLMEGTYNECFPLLRELDNLNRTKNAYEAMLSQFERAEGFPQTVSRLIKETATLLKFYGRVK